MGGENGTTVQQQPIQQQQQPMQQQQQPIQQQRQELLPEQLAAQQERERQERMRREQRLVPETGVKAKTKKLFTGTKREKAFGVTEKEVNDHFSEERSQAFTQELQRKVEEDMRKTYHKGFHNVLKKIAGYVKCLQTGGSYDDQQSAFMEVTNAIRDYQKRYQEQPNLDAAHQMGLERINMYQLYFDTITNGSLQVPKEKEFRYTQDAGKKLAKNTSLSSLSYDHDASKECLFPHEPTVGDVWQRGLGDCYLLSGLASLAKDHPALIKQSMWDDGKGHVTVRFFKKGYDHTDELPEKEKGMLADSQASELQTMNTETLILKLLTSLSNDLLEDIKFAPAVSNIYTDTVNKSIAVGTQYFFKHEGEADVQTKMEELEKKARSFMNRMGSLTLDNVPALCRLAERLAQNPEFVEKIVDAVRKENAEKNDATEALKKGYSLLADSLLDSDNPLYQEVTNLYNKLADLEEPEAVPIYVTVDKKVPRVMGADFYAANSLWVSMIERAYAASGLHNRKSRQPDSAKDQAAMNKFLNNERKILEKQDNPKLLPEEVNYLLAKKQREYMENYRRSYKNIEGGQSSDFLQTFTGIARQDHLIDDMYWNKKDNVTKTVIDSVKNGMLEIMVPYMENHDRLLAFVLDHIFQDYSMNKLQKLYDSKLYRVHVSDLVSHFCKIENWMENPKEQMKKYHLNKETLEQIVQELREKLPEYIEQEVEADRLKVQYDSMSGKYTEAANKEYKAIEDALRNHIPINVGTVSFPTGSKSGLNGERMEGGMVGGHAYAIVGVKEMDGKKFIEMRNPWRTGDTGYVKCTKPGEKTVYEKVQYGHGPLGNIFRQKEQGTFFLELNDFVKNARTIYYNSNQAVTA